jgi:uncharacterized protein YjiS (DUF1127 family)
MSHQSHQRFVDQPLGFLAPVSRSPTFGQRLSMTLRIWRERSRARRHLAGMDARSLREIGISPAAAAYETGKAFWQPFGTLR